MFLIVFGFLLLFENGSAELIQIPGHHHVYVVTITHTSAVEEIKDDAFNYALHLANVKTEKRFKSFKYVKAAIDHEKNGFIEACKAIKKVPLNEDGKRIYGEIYEILAMEKMRDFKVERPQALDDYINQARKKYDVVNSNSYPKVRIDCNHKNEPVVGSAEPQKKSFFRMLSSKPRDYQPLQ